MSVGFIAGSDSLQNTKKLMEYAKSFCGLEDIIQNDVNPRQILLLFEHQENAITAQWILDAIGAEGRDRL